MKKTAVVGFGFMGKTHALNILKNEDLKLVAIVEKNPEVVNNGFFSSAGIITTGNIDQFRIKKVKSYLTLDACLEHEQLDAVHICVHTDLHYEIVKKALTKGLHVIVEKPFCLEPVKCEDLINMAEEKGLVLMVAHVVRFMPPYQKLREWVKQGKFGKLKFLSLTASVRVQRGSQVLSVNLLSSLMDGISIFINIMMNHIPYLRI